MWISPRAPRWPQMRGREGGCAVGLGAMRAGVRWEGGEATGLVLPPPATAPGAAGGARDAARGQRHITGGEVSGGRGAARPRGAAARGAVTGTLPVALLLALHANHAEGDGEEQAEVPRDGGQPLWEVG